MTEQQIEIANSLLKRMAEKDGSWDIDNMFHFTEREFSSTQQEFSNLKTNLLSYGFIDDQAGQNYRFNLTPAGWKASKMGIVKFEETSKQPIHQETHNYHNSVINNGTNIGSMTHTTYENIQTSPSSKKSRIWGIIVAVIVATISTVIADYVSAQFNIFFH